MEGRLATLARSRMSLFALSSEAPRFQLVSEIACLALLDLR
jgi:hypothetical protein